MALCFVAAGGRNTGQDALMASMCSKRSKAKRECARRLNDPPITSVGLRTVQAGHGLIGPGDLAGHALHLRDQRDDTPAGRGTGLIISLVPHLRTDRPDRGGPLPEEVPVEVARVG